MSKQLIRKLELYCRLSVDEKATLMRISSEARRQIGPREDVLLQGERPDWVNLILEGWACRYNDLPDGRRQISSLLLPGDICDASLFIFKELDHSLGTLSPVLLARIPRTTFETLTQTFPRLDRALRWSGQVDEAIAREWITNLGMRSATERLAHLFCELFARLLPLKLTDGSGFDFPLSQEQLGQAAGLSTVHINRSLMQLRDADLITLAGRRLTILDLDGLRGLAMFDPGYLHQDHDGQAYDANEV